MLDYRELNIIVYVDEVRIIKIDIVLYGRVREKRSLII